MELSVDNPSGDDELTALARQARAGNDESFRTLVRRIDDRVRRWARGVTHDHDEADDVAQLVLLRLHAHIERFEERSRFTTWLYRITRNLAFSRMQRERRREVLLERRAPQLVADGHDAHDADSPPDAPDVTSLVASCLDELPERQREVFELGDLRGLNSTEIAERLGITPSTARGLLMKARRRMRLRMLEAHPELLRDYSP